MATCEDDTTQPDTSGSDMTGDTNDEQNRQDEQHTTAQTQQQYTIGVDRKVYVVFMTLAVLAVAFIYMEYTFSDNARARRDTDICIDLADRNKFDARQCMKYSPDLHVGDASRDKARTAQSMCDVTQFDRIATYNWNAHNATCVGEHCDVFDNKLTAMECYHVPFRFNGVFSTEPTKGTTNFVSDKRPDNKEERRDMRYWVCYALLDSLNDAVDTVMRFELRDKSFFAYQEKEHEIDIGCARDEENDACHCEVLYRPTKKHAEMFALLAKN